MKYNSDTCAIEMGVRSLCALALKCGDLDTRYKTGTEARLKGAEIHRRLMADAGAFYNSEVALANTTLHDGIYYTVSGRADGIIREGGVLTVDEIKTVKPFAFFRRPTEAELGQLKCYAYFLCVREELSSVCARLTYFNTENEEIKYFRYTFTKDELHGYYIGLLTKISFFARMSVKRSVEVLPSAANAVFPYAGLREGQELMIRECHDAIKTGGRLFIEAPTGTGKTISSMFPALLALGKGWCDKIFYLTAKSSVRREAYAAAQKLFGAGVEIRAVVLNSKENMCAHPQGCSGKNMCNPDECVRARGYYDKVNGALQELLSTANGYPARLIRSIADKHGICPYELSLDLSEYCDIIICDYNYAFDPSVYLQRYFGEGGKSEKYVFLIDEAHNLADRARDMYSAELRASELCALSEQSEDARRLVADISDAFFRLRELCRDNMTKSESVGERGFFLSRAPLDNFNAELEGFRKRCDGFLRKNADSEAYDAVYALSSRVRKYLCVCEYFDRGFLCYVEVAGADTVLKVFCLDPSRVMNTLLKRAVSSIMFSATLTPAQYFCNVLGCEKNGVSVTLPSPFDKRRLCVSVVDSLSTRYEDRAASTSKYVSVIAAAVSARSGNYMVYFPSYDCLESVYRLFTHKYPRVKTVLQKRGMTPQERESFLNSFKEDEGKTRIGFCVLGGAFSEGVDLPGSRLIGAVIFGVGLPGLSNERNIIKDYFDELLESGYDYAYTYPGMNNVLQAAGRVIRTENDRGIVVLVDDRYALPTYRHLFPEHWAGVQYAGNAASLAEILRRFWQNGGNLQ